MWYAVYTRSRHEKKVEERLIERGIEVFLPRVRVLRKWQDRKKWVEIPVFNNYLFVNIDFKDRFKVVEVYGVVRIVTFDGVPAPIPDWQINSIRLMLKSPSSLKTEEEIFPGDLVEVTGGYMKGLKGIVTEVRKKTRVWVNLDNMQMSISVEVDSGYIRIIENKKNGNIYGS